jgi:hypothetical protein
VSDNKAYQPWHRYTDALSASAGLLREDSGKALRLLDDAIALAISEQENQWVLTLSHHAAVISTFIGNLELVKHYYRQSLSSNSENPRALLGLATVARKQGEPELAKDYATRCYKALMDGDDFLKDARLETLLKQWPDIAKTISLHGSATRRG